MDKLKKRELLIFSVIMLIGLVLRIWWVLSVDTQPVSDFLLYHQGALSIISGGGFRIHGYLSAYEPIGYPGFLAGLYYIFGANIMAAKIANILLSGMMLALVYYIAGRCFSKKAGFIAMFLCAVLPVLIIYNSVLSTEVLFTALYLLIIYLSLEKTDKRYTPIVLGVVNGIMALTKPYMLIYQFVIFFIDMVSTKKILIPLKRLCITTVVMGIVICPWTIRNYRVFHEIIPVSTNGGYNLYVNNNPYATGAWQDPFKIPGSSMIKYKHTGDDFWDEVGVDKDGKKLAYDWILHNPGQFIKVGFKKVENTFLAYDDGFWAVFRLSGDGQFPYKYPLALTNKCVQVFMIIVAVIYLFIVIKDWAVQKKIAKLNLTILVNLLFYLFISFVFEGQPRYLYPIIPLFMMMAGYVAAYKYNIGILFKKVIEK